MKLKNLMYSVAIAVGCCIGFAAKAQVKHVILISIDGFHPDMYIDTTWPAPNLRKLMKMGTYADHLISTFPSYTYPSHTAMVTGAQPARSGINFNQPKSDWSGNWNWFTSAIRVPTLWQVLKQHGLTTAGIEWPVSVPKDKSAITWNMPEIWDNGHPDDRVTEARRYATPGLIEEIEQYATGKLNSSNMQDSRFSLDENLGRAAAYILKKYKPNFLALHFACVDEISHEQGRDADSVRMALAADDRAIGDILEAIQYNGLKDSTAIIIVGDHGFATIHQVMRPNMLIRGLPVRFVAAGGSAFLYLKSSGSDLPEIEEGMRTAKSWAEQIVRKIGKPDPALKDFQGYKPAGFQEAQVIGLITNRWPKYKNWAKIDAKGLDHIEISNHPPYSFASLAKQVTDSLNTLPKDKRKLFRIIDRKELDQMGADSSALLALSGVNGSGLVFSGSTGSAQAQDHGPGTLIQNNKLEGVFIPAHGGHHGFDPANPEMWTGFITYGPSIKVGGHIQSLREVDIAPLIAKLLNIEFNTPDGKLPEGIIQPNN